MSISVLTLVMKGLLLAFLASPLTQAYTRHDFTESDDLDIAGTLSARGLDVSNLEPLRRRGTTRDPSIEAKCTAACKSLQTIFGPDQVLLPTSPTYRAFTIGYWSSIQAAVQPSCVFQPYNAGEVSTVILLARHTNCPFAVTSGGHAPSANASSIDAGITVSLKALNDVKLSENQSIASVGPGNTWGSVLKSLSPYELMVSGGRTADVGVGGLLLGGGLSYMVNLHGWACDNVASFEVVTANGTILEASPTTNQDLYLALRGGGPNFGIVTKYNLFTHSLPKGELWIGSSIYTSNLEAAVHAFTDGGAIADTDVYADQVLTFSSDNGKRSATASLYHAKQNISSATIFSNYRSIPAESEEIKKQPIGSAAEEEALQTPSGYRQYFYTITFKNDERINNIAKDIFYQEYNAFDRVGASVRMILQSVNKSQLRQMQVRGGNALGLKEEDGPLTIVLIPATWQGSEHDEVMYTTGSNILRRMKAEAVKLNLNKDFLYMNYASPYQDAVASYGQENKQRLMEIAHKYDPDGVFQQLQPGYVKLDRAAVPGTTYFNF